MCSEWSWRLEKHCIRCSPFTIHHHPFLTKIRYVVDSSLGFKSSWGGMTDVWSSGANIALNITACVYFFCPLKAWKTKKWKRDVSHPVRRWKLNVVTVIWLSSLQLITVVNKGFSVLRRTTAYCTLTDERTDRAIDGAGFLLQYSPKSE